MSTPPRWDLSTVYTGLDSPAFRAATAQLRSGIRELAALLDARTGTVGPPTGVDDAAVTAFEEIVGRYEALLEVGWTIESLVMAVVDTDADDQAATAAEGEIQAPMAALRHLGRQLAGWLDSIDPDALRSRSPIARERELAIRRLRDQATHVMADEAEALVADLHPVAGAAWGTLRARVIAGIHVELDGESVPLSVLRGMATDPDRTVRRRAYEAEVAAYATNAIPLTAALNGVVGERSVLARRRRWASPLDEALFAQGLDRATLDALVTATRAALPDLRRHPDAKARMLGAKRLAWFDLAVPVGDPRVWTFDEAADLVTAAFSRFSPRLGGLAERAVAERWIDAEPRAGKQGGGLCYLLPNGRSLIRVEFHGGYDGVRMLAHELGHAYHFHVLHREGRPPLQIESAPAPPLETASKLCEEVVRREAVARCRRSGDTRAEFAMLDGFLTGARRSVVDALTNFLFEERLFGLRAERPLSTDDVNGLMDELRAEVNGDALDPAFPYPWTWATQPHLYLDGQAFYNLPYLFGQLLALGLYARFEESPRSFPERLDEFLADVGRRSIGELGRSFGFDLAATEFWADGLAVIGREIDRYEELVGDG